MVFAIITLSTVSCNKKEKMEPTTEKEEHEHKDGETHKVAYECPMNCEKDKIYDEKGTCPVCKMDLIEAKADNHEGHDHSKENHDGHNHSKEGSEESHEGHNH